VPGGSEALGEAAEANVELLSSGDNPFSFNEYSKNSL
jgi:hypothetical protein